MKPLLLIAVATLAVGCATSKTEPLEEKVLEVKEEVKTEESITETKPKLEGVNLEEGEEREGIWYLKDSETPYSGKVYALHPNGQKMGEGNYKDGKLNGISLQWNSLGQKIREVNFKDGNADGLAVSWHKNGQKDYEANFKDGKQNGLFIAWYENGQKNMEVNYKNGKRDGLLVVWHENGQKMGEGSYKDGKEVSSKYWNSKGEPVDSRKEAEAE